MTTKRLWAIINWRISRLIQWALWHRTWEDFKLVWRN